VRVVGRILPLVPALFLPVLRRLVLEEEVLQLLPRLVPPLLVKLPEEEEQQKLPHLLPQLLLVDKQFLEVMVLFLLVVPGLLHLLVDKANLEVEEQQKLLVGPQQLPWVEQHNLEPEIG